MSAEALRTLQAIQTMYRQAGSPPDRGWYCYPGETSAALTELAELGLVSKVLGTAKGFAWQLTDAGRAHAG